MNNYQKKAVRCAEGVLATLAVMTPQTPSIVELHKDMSAACNDFKNAHFHLIFMRRVFSEDQIDHWTKIIERRRQKMAEQSEICKKFIKQSRAFAKSDTRLVYQL